jgi:hypothetical protein
MSIKMHKKFIQVSDHFAKHRPSHIETCEAVCETNPIVSESAKAPFKSLQS